MSWDGWVLFAATNVVVCLVPGPAVLFISAQGLSGGVRRSLHANFGILAANSVYLLLSATGLGALLLASYELFFLVKWLGAAYLVYLGLRTLLARSVVGSVAAARPASPLRVFIDAVSVQFANPKAILFFSAILPQFLDPSAPVIVQLAALWATSIAIEFLVLLGYGFAAGHIARFALRPRFAAFTNKIAGGLLIGAGVGLAALRRS